VNVLNSDASDNEESASRIITLKEAAIAYGEIGLAVLPLAVHGKRPILNDGFHGASARISLIRSWWNHYPEANIGAVPGSIGCVVVDVDGLAGERFAKQLGILDVDTVWTATKKGMHVWLRLPSGMIVGNVARTQLDVRAHAGYVLMSPSVHPSGVRYGMRGSFNAIAAAPGALVAWLQDAARRPSHAPRRVSPSTTRSGIPRRLVSYLARLRPLRDGEGRNATAYRLAAFALHEACVDQSDAWIVLQVWNARNHEPLPDHQLQQVLGNALRYGAGRAS